jgi:hypothetical protein
VDVLIVSGFIASVAIAAYRLSEAEPEGGNSDELRAIIRPYVSRWAPRDEPLCQRRQDILTSEPSRNREGKALVAGFIDDRQELTCARHAPPQGGRRPSFLRILASPKSLQREWRPSKEA